MMKRSRSWWSVLLVAWLVVAGAACSGGSDDSDEDSKADVDTEKSDDKDSDDEESDDKDSDADEEDPDVDVNDDVADEDIRPDVEVIGYEDAIFGSLDDIQSFWEDELPETYDLDYTYVPDDSIIPYSSEVPPPSCGGMEMSYDEMVGNAFWCYPDDYMAWDDEGLFPELYTDYGPFAIAMVLAHEWGHAIQDQTMFDETTILHEQQADCFAGAWAAHVIDEGDEDLGFRLADLELALAGMLKFRDAPGSVSTDPGAHGSGFDRINAFQEGFELGSDRCAEYDANPPTQVDLVFLDEADYEAGGNLPYDDAIELASMDLNAYWTELNSDFEVVEEIIPYDPATEKVPDCNGEELSEDDGTYMIRFCFDENYVIWDDVMMRTVHENIGDFGVATLLGLAWTEAAQKQLGSDEAFITSRDGALQQACFTGSWAGRLMVPDSSELIAGLSPGDLDEAIQSFLAFSETPDERGETQLGSAFERSQAFRIGFFDGPSSCDEFSG